MTTHSTIHSICAALILAAAITLPARGEQKLLPAQSEITFVAKQMGVTVEGRFKRFDAQITFDPAQPDSARIAFTVDVGSATLGSAEADSEMPKAAWFNAIKFPQATFQSSAVKALGGGKFEVSGKLSIKGNAHDVLVPMTLSSTGISTIASGTFPIKRLAFKVGEGEWTDTSTVADDVQVRFKVALSGVGKF